LAAVGLGNGKLGDESPLIIGSQLETY